MVFYGFYCELLDSRKGFLWFWIEYFAANLGEFCLVGLAFVLLFILMLTVDVLNDNVVSNVVQWKSSIFGDCRVLLIDA